MLANAFEKWYVFYPITVSKYPRHTQVKQLFLQLEQWTHEQNYKDCKYMDGKGVETRY